MKFTFSRSKDYTPEWNGNRLLPESEQVKAVVRPLDVSDLFVMMDAIGVSNAGDMAAKTKDDYNRVVREFANVLPKYVTVTGLSDEDGEVSVEDLTRYGAYMPLATELAMFAINMSMPSVAAEGNSEALPV